MNDKIVKGNYKCKIGDVIIIEVLELEEFDVVVEEMDLDIYYED